MFYPPDGEKPVTVIVSLLHPLRGNVQMTLTENSGAEPCCVFMRRILRLKTHCLVYDDVINELQLVSSDLAMSCAIAYCPFCGRMRGDSERGPVVAAMLLDFARPLQSLEEAIETFGEPYELVDPGPCSGTDPWVRACFYEGLGGFKMRIAEYEGGRLSVSVYATSG